MYLRRTCKEVAALLIAREDRALPLADRISLRFHMVACKACPVFERQMLTMRQAMGQWRHYTENDPPAEPPTPEQRHSHPFS